MGDEKNQEPRRSSLIVTSTPTTAKHGEAEDAITESPGKEEPEFIRDPSTLPTSSIGIGIHNQDIDPDKDPQEGSDNNNMYGPTLAVYPQWQQFPHQHFMMAPQQQQHQQQLHTRFVQSNYQHPQSSFNMQSLQRSLPSLTQQSQYSVGASPQPIPYEQGQSHGQSHYLHHIPAYQATTYYDPYGQPFASPPAAATPTHPQNQHHQHHHHQHSQQPQHGYAAPAYSSSYPPQSHSTGSMQAPSFGHWGVQSHVNPYYYLPPHPPQHQGQGSPMQLQFPSQPPMAMPQYGSRRQSAPYPPRFHGDIDSSNFSGDGDRAQFGMHRSSNSPRGFGRGKRQGQGFTGIGKPQSPISQTPSMAGTGSTSGMSSSLSNIGSSTLHPSLPRGPPRKPRQSGHALWVGNLPPGTNVVALKDYFATPDIESVFLISKSNCAFVNYRSEDACNAAMAKFHDSRFQGVRLVCRLRRSSSPGASAAASASPSQISSADPSPEPGVEHSKTPPEVQSIDDIKEEPQLIDSSRSAQERYFIVKSLTVEDLELSVRNNVWATQSHNENLLNAAFESTENVFLIFSANKSGEYFGYARMSSAISEEVASKIDWAPASQSSEDLDLPKAIFTPATESAPKGRIIDDSSRGTIFWEAVDESNSDEESSGETDATGERTTVSKSWGKPFRVEWISTARVPFYRTRGLRNPYNVSREVKIARDGTELEPSVGRRLLQLFHRGNISPTSYGMTLSNSTPPIVETSIPQLVSDQSIISPENQIPVTEQPEVQASVAEQVPA